MISAALQPDQVRESQIQNSRSRCLILILLCGRFRTASCSRNARFSRARSCRSLDTIRKQNRNQRQQVPHTRSVKPEVKSQQNYPRSSFGEGQVMRHTSQMCSISLYRRHRFPAEVISHCVWLYFRFALSLRDIEEMLAIRFISLRRTP
jgi:hypothetical protein